MDETSFCPVCHQLVPISGYFCPNCGKNLRPSPPLTTTSVLITLFIKTIFLPPLGLYWGYKYLLQPDQKSKLVGYIIIAITIVEIIWLIQSTISFTNTFTQQLNQQTQLYGL